jgi:hypothetical protein
MPILIAILSQGILASSPASFRRHLRSLPNKRQ